MYKYVEIKLYAPEQPTGQRRNENAHFFKISKQIKTQHTKTYQRL